MSDKSPRQSPSKKSGKSIKEKRAIKKSRKATVENDRIGVFLRSGARDGGDPHGDRASARPRGPVVVHARHRSPGSGSASSRRSRNGLSRRAATSTIP